jgi:ketosteroid isomerase-like protein
MTEEDVQVLRTALEAFNRGDLEAVRPLLDPRVEWLAQSPYPYRCDGPHQVIEQFAKQAAVGPPESVEFVDAGDRVVVFARGPFQTPDGEPVPEAVLVVTVRDGRIVHMQGYGNREEALAAVGIPA